MSITGTVDATGAATWTAERVLALAPDAGSQRAAGGLGRDEAAVHPQRSLLVRALGTGALPVEADLALRTALPGDRYLLCSDGLSAVVDRDTLHNALGTPAEPQAVVRRLIELAYEHGAPDNIACVVADVVAA